MDNTELHYITYDPEAMWKDMMLAYIEAGGDVLYPGDEKEILLRGVQQMFFLAFAGVDNALRMDTLRYAVREYLDIYGQKRNCYRIEAAAATATVRITFRATGEAKTIPAGTPLTQDGETLFTLVEDVAQTGYAGTVTAEIICSRTGSVGNGLLSGSEMQFLIPQDGVESVFCVADAQGGQEAEDDETYRERIRTHGLATVTTGPAEQYRSAAMAVSSNILDAHPMNVGAGNVCIYLLLADETGAAALIEAVKEALRPTDTRPLTDNVSATLAEPVPYTLKVQYSIGSGSGSATAISEAVAAYTEWQDHTIGQTFDPDRLKTYLYNAGCMAVQFEEGSNFDGGEVKRTAIEEYQYCKGTITLEAVTV